MWQRLNTDPKARKGLFVKDWGKAFQAEKNVNGMKAGWSTEGEMECWEGR